MIKEACGYLKSIFPIGYLTEGRFAHYKDTEFPPESDEANPFAYWLNEKTEYHRSRDELSFKDLDEARGQSMGGGK